MERLKSGSYSDFTVLYAEYAPRLYAFARRLTRSDDFADDVVQTTFIKVWTHHKQIDCDMSFRSLLFTIVKNQILNEFRRRASSPLFFKDILSADLAGREDGAEIERKLAYDDLNKEFLQVKSKLSPRRREILELYKDEGLTAEEIAGKLRISVQSVRNQLSQALRQVRIEMRKYLIVVAIMVSTRPFV